MNLKNLRLHIKISLSLIIILSGISCKAPRTNPLDPLNPDYSYGTLEGVVQSVGIPSVGIDNVSVVWQNANLLTGTDANGRFRLYNIPIKDGNIIFSKTGYKSDTLEVVWGSSKRFFTQVFFNRVPVLDTMSLYTVVINQSSTPRYELNVKAWITDHDGDVIDFLIYNPSLNLRKLLSYNSGEENYQLSISQQELNVADIEQIIGLEFFILTEDRFGNEFIIGNEIATRVIKNEVTGLQPSNDSTISAQPVTFLWNKFDAGYNFTHSIEVFTNDQQLVHSKTGIPSDSTSYTMSSSLSPGNYNWVIWIVDQFQNRSRSKPAAFHIP